MLEPLIQLLRDIWSDIRPWVVVKEYTKGVRFRFGGFNRVLDPGIYFNIPHFDDVEFCVHVTTTLDLPAQSVLTSDGESIVIKGVVKYRISNVEKFYTEVTDAIGALRDISMGCIFDACADMSWDELRTADLPDVITPKVRKMAFRWGMEVDRVTITDLSKMKSLRLIGGPTQL